MRPSCFASLVFAAASAIVAACGSTNDATTPRLEGAAPPTITETPLPSPDAAALEAGPEKDAAPSVTPTSKGCAIAPAKAGALTKKTTSAAGKTRTYHLSVPSGLVTKQLAPLVFVLHGAGDTAAQNMRDWFGVEGKMTGGLFVYPQALPRTRKDGSGGHVTRWDLYGNEDTALFDAILAEVSNDYCVDRARVFVTGFSSGGNFSQQLACLRAKDVKGMAVVAGPGPFVDTCGGAVSAWMTHDTNDDALPVQDARDSRDFWLTQNGCSKTTWADVAGRPECKRNNSCGAGNALVYCETSGVGHDIPGFATSAIADFFGTLGK